MLFRARKPADKLRDGQLVWRFGIPTAYINRRLVFCARGR